MPSFEHKILFLLPTQLDVICCRRVDLADMIWLPLRMHYLVYKARLRENGCWLDQRERFEKKLDKTVLG